MALRTTHLLSGVIQRHTISPSELPGARCHRGVLPDPGPERASLGANRTNRFSRSKQLVKAETVHTVRQPGAPRWTGLRFARLTDLISSTIETPNSWVTGSSGSVQMKMPNQQVVLESLVAYGAPLGGYAPAKKPLPFEQTLVLALTAARANSTVLRVLPAVLRNHATQVQLDALKRWAERLHQKAELGFLLDQTDKLFDVPRLRGLVKDLVHAKHPEKPVPFFDFDAASERALKLAQTRTPEVARHWGFVMNMPDSSFKRA
jgi:hypothetical protein